MPTADAAAPKRKRGRGADPEQTRTTLIDAAAESLRIDGYGGTTARSIAGRADCNQAAIYYHFGGMDALLIAALKRGSADRLERYRSALSVDLDLPALVTQLDELYREDRESGHLAVMAELVGGITANPDLRAGIEESTGEWLVYVEEKIAEVAATTPFGAMVPAAELADVIFSLVIGVELRSKIDGRNDRAERIFNLGKILAAMVPSK